MGGCTQRVRRWGIGSAPGRRAGGAVVALIAVASATTPSRALEDAAGAERESEGTTDASTDTSAPVSAPVRPREEPEASDAAPMGDSGMRKFTLENGLDVVVAVDRLRPRVGIALQVDAGFEDDPPEYEGLAHVTEHAMFEGAAHSRSGDYWHSLRRLGATYVQAMTGERRTVYLSEVPRDSLAQALWIEAERAALALEHLDADGVRRAVESVIDEAKHRSRDTFGVAVQAIYGPGHSLARRGSFEVEHIDLDEVRWFVQQHYDPSNATLALVGDLEIDATERLVRDIFSRWAARPGLGAKAHRARRDTTDRLTENTVLHEHARLWRQRLSIVWPVADASMHMTLELQAIATALRTAVRDRGLDHAGVRAHDLGPGRPRVFSIMLWLPTTHGFELASGALQTVLERVCATDRPPQVTTELASAIALNRQHAILTWDLYAHRAAALAGRPEEASYASLRAQLQAHAALTPEGVAATCRRLLVDGRRVEVWTGWDEHGL